MRNLLILIILTISVSLSAQQYAFIDATYNLEKDQYKVEYCVSYDANEFNCKRVGTFINDGMNTYRSCESDFTTLSGCITLIEVDSETLMLRGDNTRVLLTSIDYNYYRSEVEKIND